MKKYTLIYIFFILQKKKYTYMKLKFLQVVEDTDFIIIL